MSLKLVEDLTPEDHRKRYRDAHAEAEKQHHYRIVEAEREFASELLTAEATRKAAIETAPMVVGSGLDNTGFATGDEKVIEAAQAVYRKTHADAEQKRLKTIERSRETLAQDIDAAKRALRKSPGWQGWWP